MERPLKTTVVFLACFLLAASHAAAYSEEKAGFAVKVREDACPYKVLGIYVLPRETLAIEIIRPGPQDTFVLDAESGTVTRSRAREWTWQAPQAPGLYPVKIERNDSDDAILLNIFVMIPFKPLERESFNGYRIGSYPSVPLKNLPIYRPPTGFIEVTPENEETLISPHFTLGQFICKQKGGDPKYVALRERLLLKLEYLLQVVNETGYTTESFFVMSGFRTPSYNAAIGNVKYSRHLWGGAADIFIDERPKDGVMDDLNGDGRRDGKDSALLFDLMESLQDSKAYEPFRGGLGRYGATSSHGPFLHVDVRGFKARWGR